MVMKSDVHKVRRLHGGKVVAGFAGAAADAFALLERFEAKLKDYQGNVPAPPRSWPRTGAWTGCCAAWRR